MSNVNAAKKVAAKKVAVKTVAVKAAKAKPEKVTARAQVNAYFTKELAKKASKANPDGMNDTAWRKHILAEISTRFSLDDSGAATAYNYAKKQAVAAGLVEDFARSGRIAGLTPVAKNVPKNAQLKVEAVTTTKKVATKAVAAKASKAVAPKVAATKATAAKVVAAKTTKAKAPVIAKGSSGAGKQAIKRPAVTKAVTEATAS